MRHTAYAPVAPGTFSDEPAANALKIEVFYSKGGINYFNCQTDPRGYYASVRPVEHKNDGTEIFMMFTTNPIAGKLLLAPAARLNRKTLDALADKVLAVAPELGMLAAAGNKAALLAKIREAADVQEAA